MGQLDHWPKQMNYMMSLFSQSIISMEIVTFDWYVKVEVMWLFVAIIHVNGPSLMNRLEKERHQLNHLESFDIISQAALYKMYCSWMNCVCHWFLEWNKSNSHKSTHKIRINKTYCPTNFCYLYFVLYSKNAQGHMIINDVARMVVEFKIGCKFIAFSETGYFHQHGTRIWYSYVK